jgi:hypothetical protein
VAAAIVLVSPSAGAQTVRQDLWSTDGLVSCAARSGNLLYIGGDFSYVGPGTGSGVPLYGTTGAPLGPFPKVLGRISAVNSPTGGRVVRRRILHQSR